MTQSLKTEPRIKREIGYMLCKVHVWKWPVVKYKHIKIKSRTCILFILCLTWMVNANSLKQNNIVLKEICSCLPPFCKQNLLLFIQPRWQLRRTYFLIAIMFCFNKFSFLNWSLIPIPIGNPIPVAMSTLRIA